MKKATIVKGLAIYAGTSYYFLLNPQLIHGKPKKRLKMPLLEEGCSHYIIAHRGGSMENPENTLQAFRHAISEKCGAHMIETDVRYTKDGVIVVCHDDNFHRLSGANSTARDQLVRETNLADLPRFRDRIPIHFSKSQPYKMREGDQTYFSTLEEVFEALPRDKVI
jgi:glycerophosphoryl diester phosphodiesterase